MRRAQRKPQHTPRERAALGAALAWAKERGFDGDRLPSGIKGDSTYCPLARATGCIIAGHTYLLPDQEYLWFAWKEFSPNVATFIDLFDEGCYPEMIL